LERQLATATLIRCWRWPRLASSRTACWWCAHVTGNAASRVGGEREAVRALLDNNVGTAIIDGNRWRPPAKVLPPGTTRVVARGGPYDHCNAALMMRAGASALSPLLLR
jgi:hypothetical protein